MELSNARARRVVRLRRRRGREKEGRVLVEGPRAVRTALQGGGRMEWAAVSPRLDTVDPGLVAELAARGDVVDVDDPRLAELADTEAPQGVLAVFTEPNSGWFDGVGASSRLLVLDGIQDPGNVGTLVRSAAAFALDGVVVLDGSADPWGAKSVRASAGAAFLVPLAVRPAEGVIARLGSVDLPLLVADAAGEPPHGRAGGRGWALAIGSEGKGARDVLQAVAASRVRVEMPGPTESLNAGVAGSILLYELTRSHGGPVA